MPGCRDVVKTLFIKIKQIFFKKKTKVKFIRCPNLILFNWFGKWSFCYFINISAIPIKYHFRVVTIEIKACCLTKKNAANLKETSRNKKLSKMDGILHSFPCILVPSSFSFCHWLIFIISIIIINLFTYKNGG